VTRVDETDAKEKRARGDAREIRFESVILNVWRALTREAP